ncbi:MAG: hypothetical protein IKZ99_01340 [Salinivirgaceae bacterium]|nr:hypothetical protein [Salinivirgaceae bacterium]
MSRKKMIADILATGIFTRQETPIKMYSPNEITQDEFKQIKEMSAKNMINKYADLL